MIYAMAAVAMMAVGCQKDRNADGMLLLAEGFNNNSSKVLVDGLTSTWADGDEVRINDQTATVSVTTGNASVHLGSGVDAPFYGVYPAGIYNSNSGASYTLNLPATYTYETDGTHQKLASPMVGYTDNSTSMTFKHLTAAVTVQIKNDFGIDVTVTNVTVSSNKYKLNGTTAVTLGNSIAVAAEETDNAALRQVQMNFTGTALNITSGNSANVQVPVLPVGYDNRFTISVTVQNKDDAEMVYTFNKTQGSTQDTYALGRAELGYAPAKFGGVFTINASGDKVRFAPGNLQYFLGSLGEDVSRWSFKAHQYDRSTSITSGYYSTSTTQPNKEGYIDLFGWGASGIEGSATRYLPWQYAWTGSFREDVGEGNIPLTIDWGYNAIGNGGNAIGLWRTLTSDEWTYLWNTREVEGFVNSVSRATVENIPGLIILPDNFVDPQTNSSASHTGFYPGPNSSSMASFTDNVYNGNGWAAMQTAGVVFLPACGYRSGSSLYKFSDNYIWYWTATSVDGANKQQANAMTNNNTSAKPSASNAQSRLYGMPVRLVRDVE